MFESTVPQTLVRADISGGFVWGADASADVIRWYSLDGPQKKLDLMVNVALVGVFRCKS